MPSILLLQVRAPSHHTIFDILQSHFLVENREVQRVLHRICPREPAHGEYKICSFPPAVVVGDRKSTRLNSSHGYISYAVFCLKKKKKILKQEHVALYA